MKSAIDIMTGLGGDWFVPMAFLIIPRTIANRTNDVVDIKKNGAILIEEMASNKFTDELNWRGSVNELRSMFIPVDCANRLDDIKKTMDRIIFIIVYRLNWWIDS